MAVEVVDQCPAALMWVHRDLVAFASDRNHIDSSLGVYVVVMAVEYD